jgi:high-affinity iron transporter
MSPRSRAAPLSRGKSTLAVVAALPVAALLVWQGLFAHGAPDPLASGLSRSAVMLSSGILVFREGLEAVLVLAAVTAGLARYRTGFWRPVRLGVAAALLATVVTWFIAVAIISAVNASELAIQAATGLLAVVVLLIVMNWFFHRLYWTGWISHHCKRRKRLFEETDASGSRVMLGLALLGFTAVYREGFEVVLFLQNLRLRAGSGIVLGGAGLGLALTAIVAALTFIAHRRLPFRRMLVLTGILLATVLIVMIGESAQEMQQAGWLTIHRVPLPIPDWMGMWFAVFPTFEGLASQLLAVVLLLGSYLWVRSRVPRAVTGDAASSL